MPYILHFSVHLSHFTFHLSSFSLLYDKKIHYIFSRNLFFHVFLKDFILHKKANAVVDIFPANSFSHFVETLLCIIRIYNLLISVNSSFSVQTSESPAKSYVVLAVIPVISTDHVFIFKSSKNY